MTPVQVLLQVPAAADGDPFGLAFESSMEYVDSLEKALEKSPKAVILGVEPEDTETLSVGLTLTIQAKV